MGTAAMGESSEVKRGVISTALSTLASIATQEAKKNGTFVIPGVVMIKTRQKKATKAGKREIFGKNRHGEGEAGQDHREGLPRESPQGRVLRASWSVASPAKRLRVCSSSSSSCSSSMLPSFEESSCHFVQVGWRLSGHAWPSRHRTPSSGDHMYSTSVSPRRKK